MLDEGLTDCAKNIHPVEFEMPGGDRIRLSIESISIAHPQVPASCTAARNKKVYPTECRQRASTYTGRCTVSVGWSVNGVSKPTVDKYMGDIPVMLRVCIESIINVIFIDNSNPSSDFSVESMQFKLPISETTHRARRA